MRKLKNRYAFTMIELIFVVVAMAGIYIAIFKFSEARDKAESREKAVSHFITLITKFVYERNTGYATDKGDPCAHDYSVRDISAYRIKECTDFAGYEVVELDNTVAARIDGSQSYFGFLQQYAIGDTAPLKIYIDEQSDYEIRVLIVAETDDAGVVEQMFGAAAQDVLAPYFVAAYYNAESLDDVSYLGNEKDGVIRLHFRD